eukprot:scaffold25178_cov83-Skeletonema_dohrnii-CCMP3373.AAC.1
MHHLLHLSITLLVQAPVQARNVEDGQVDKEDLLLLSWQTSEAAEDMSMSPQKERRVATDLRGYQTAVDEAKRQQRGAAEEAEGKENWHHLLACNLDRDSCYHLISSPLAQPHSKWIRLLQCLFVMDQY